MWKHRHWTRRYSQVIKPRPFPASQSKQKPLPLQVQDVRESTPQTKEEKTETLFVEDSKHAKRNPLGVQLLSRSLHAQLFPSPTSVSHQPPPASYIQIAHDHLAQHALSPTLASSLPSTTFPLPPLQGQNLAEHFHRIGRFQGDEYLQLAWGLVSSMGTLPPVPDPENWNVDQSGWTRYTFVEGGASFSEPVEYPTCPLSGEEEEALVFDVETMPAEGHPYPVLAVAVSRTAWYVWISPWLLGESENPEWLIPMGPSSSSDKPKLIVGHNVSFDRSRLKNEYTLAGSKTRFLDTMSLHVAVSGISSHQRPAWKKWKKGRDREKEMREEAVVAVRALVGRIEEEEARLLDEKREDEPAQERLGKLRKLREDIEESLAASSSSSSDLPDSIMDEGEVEAKTWEDLTASSSLVDVARLHLGVDIERTKLGTRKRLLKLTRKEVVPDLSSYPSSIEDTNEDNELLDEELDEELDEHLHEDTDDTPLTLADMLTYCAKDVLITHQVFAVVLPSFLTRCPHPVSFAGILTMGSSFLTVNETWEEYLKNAEGVYRKMEEVVKRRLEELANEGMELARPVKINGKEVEWEDGVKVKWERDPWLAQLDWTPKRAGKSRGVVTASEESPQETEEPKQTIPDHPKWYQTLLSSPFSSTSVSRIIPLLLNLSYKGNPLRYTTKDGWYYLETDEGGGVKMEKLPTSRGQKTTQVLGPKHGKTLLASGEMGSRDVNLALMLCGNAKEKEGAEERVRELARQVLEEVKQNPGDVKNPWLSQLDWSSGPKESKKPKPMLPAVYWPKWYWDLTCPKKDLPPGTIDLSPRNRIAPLLLKLAWRGHPLYHSREHGWCYRVAGQGQGQGNAGSQKTHGNALTFSQPADTILVDLALHRGCGFYKLPHKDGEKANVGSPLGKSFVKYAADGTLTSPGGEAKEALELNAVCSYWMSSRDRIMNQMVMWEGGGAERLKLGFEKFEGTNKKWGMILPQMVTMGTVTRRAIEKTWLTASNAKKNRVGSELKAMVRAPPGYAIVGADVDSEELWISSCMGDAQFGMHGATALGWMTLEGTKAAGTDLHSKTAKILGLSRDQAKVFNYSRIYGAGMKHAILLLLQANAGMSVQGAHQLAENLYASTKGKNTHRPDIFERKFWFGGSESYVFNKLEEIANSEKPKTPALGCGVTHALSREYLPNQFGSDFMPSRINWVVQSSGVDYLHMLIVSMDYLIARYGIQARYLISVHDELRYLVAEKDKYRAALALQIANLWTRSMFAYMLGMDDLPQGVAFFSAVDVDTCLRKEVDMECVTPSQPIPIPPGESLGIEAILQKTGGSLGPVHPVGGASGPEEFVGSLEGYEGPDCLSHRCKSAAFLRAQATQDFGEVKGLAQQAYGVKFEGGIGSGAAGKKLKDKKGNKNTKSAPVGNGEGIDWSDAVEELLAGEQRF